MIIEFDESTPLHTIKELAPGLRVEERAVELSIPELERAAKIEFAVDFGSAPASFVKLSYNDVPLDPQRSGHGAFVFDPKEFGHTLKIEFDTKTIPAPKQKELPQWEGQINFRVEGDEKWSAFFIQVEKFLGDETFDGVFAVDLGTTNSCVAYWEVKPEPNFLPTAPTLLGEGQSVASAVNVLDLEPFKQLAMESYDIGQAAVGSPRKTNLHFSVKRGIGTKRKYVLTEGTEIWNADAQHMYTAVAKKLLQEGKAAIGKSITEIVVTSPPRWNAIQMMECRNTWRALGFSPDRIDMSTDEATGCAFYYVLYPLFQRFGKKSALRDYVETEFGPMKTGEGQFDVNLLAMDFGGGTTDLALVKCHLQFEAQHLAVEMDVVDRGGRQDLGGDNLTLYVFDLLKRRLALALAAPNRLVNPEDKNPPPSNPWIKHYRLDPQQAAILQKWGDIQKHLNDPTLPRDIWDLLNGILPTAWDWKGMPPAYRKFKPVARKNFDYLWQQAEQVKKALCVEVAQAMAGKRNMSEAELKALEAKWLAPDLEEFQGEVSLAESVPMAQEDEEFKKKFLSITYGDICNFVRPSVQGLCEEARRMEVRSLPQGKKIDRVVLAGNGARIPVIGPIVNAARDKGGLGTSQEQIKFDAGTAKLAVPIGACLRRIARKVEGFKININMSRSLLPFELYTNLGTRSVKMFDVGQIDEFRFFMRRGVSEDLEVEFVTRLEESDAGTENYKPYVLFKTTAEGLPLIDLKKEDELWEALDMAYGLDAIPRLKDVMGGTAFGAYDPKKGDDPKGGVNVVKAAAPTKEFKKVGDKVYTYGDMYKILSTELRLPQKISWIEEAFSEPLPEGEIVHRYYLDVTKQLFLVRHHWKEGKTLYAAETDEKALEELPAERNPFSGMH